MKIYSVTVGLYGYMPNNEPYWTRSKEDAIAYAKAEKDAFLDYGANDIRVTGNIRRDMCYDVMRKDYDGEWVSWQYIEIAEIDITQEEWAEYLEYSL